METNSLSWGKEHVEHPVSMFRPLLQPCLVQDAHTNPSSWQHSKQLRHSPNDIALCLRECSLSLGSSYVVWGIGLKGLVHIRQLFYYNGGII